MNPFLFFGRWRIRGQACSGFSLLELLVVISIMSVLAAASAPSIMSLLRGSQLSQGEEMVENQLSLGRQLALSKNEIVQVNFYEFVDPTMSGELAAGHIRGIQIFEVSPSGSLTAATKAYRLPAPVIMDAGSGVPKTTLSSLFDGSNTSPVLPTGLVSGPPIFGSITSYATVSFQFNPDGSTNLNPAASWFLTLHSVSAGDKLTAVPTNYYTVQIDPSYGHLATFRP